MRRAPRKKQDASSSREEARTPPRAPGVVRRQQPPQEILQQQRKRHQDEVANLTTKNYRLAKELVRVLERVFVMQTRHYLISTFFCVLNLLNFFLFFQADLRLKHRDECKHVTRLTMENVSMKCEKHN